MNAAAADRTVGDVRAAGAAAQSFIGDLSTYAAAEALVEFAIAQFGHLDVLVNNVGGATALKPYTSGIRTTSWQR